MTILKKSPIKFTYSHESHTLKILGNFRIVQDLHTFPFDETRHQSIDMDITNQPTN